MTDISQLFFRPMQSAMTANDSSRVGEADLMRKSLDTIMLDEATTQLFPRHASAKADNFIDRLVDKFVGVATIVRSQQQPASEAPNAQEENIKENSIPPAKRPRIENPKGTLTGGTPQPVLATPAHKETLIVQPTDKSATRKKSKKKNQMAEFVPDDASIDETGDDFYEDDENNQTDIGDSDESAGEDDDDRGAALYESSDDSFALDVADPKTKANDDLVFAQMLANARTIGASDGSASDDDDESDAEFAADEVPKAKKLVRKSNPTGESASATARSKKQADLKRKRATEFKDENSTDAVFTDYVYIAGMQASGLVPNFRTLLLSEPPESEKGRQLANSLTRLEAYINESFRAAHSNAVREIVDFVKGAVELCDRPSWSPDNDNTVCDIAKRHPKADEKLVCLRALHHMPLQNRTIGVWKQKIVLSSLRSLVEALWFAHNLMPLTEQMCRERLSKITRFHPTETTVAEAIELLITDPVKKSVSAEVKRRLKNSLDIIDTSVRKLG